MDKTDFRIVEQNNKFTIQKRIKARLWPWQNYSWYWYDAATDGDIVRKDDDFNIVNTRCKVYDNLHDARKAVNMMIRRGGGEIIHNL